MISNNTKAYLKTAILLPLTIAALTAFQATVSADQLAFNGGFTADTSAWKIKTVDHTIKTSWDKAGESKPGSIKFTTTGRKQRGESRATQRLETQIQAGSKGTISFSWKKNWSSILPEKQRIYLSIIKPDYTYEAIWANMTLSNNNEWSAESVDISRFINQTGRYTVVLGAILENGNSQTANTSAWIDDIAVDIESNQNNDPRTSILNPTGSSFLPGDSTSINGVATDDAGIDSVEVSIQRYDDAWWNGDSWVRRETWKRAEITSGARSRSAAWNMSWPLPTSDGAHFIIRARATDIVGNREAIPIECTVRVDNVASIGNIVISGGSPSIDSERVIVSNDVKGAAEMRFSIDEGRTWTPWTKFTPAAQVELTKGDGMKIVNAEFRDTSDNIYRTSDTVALDTVPPVARSIFPKENATKISPAIKVGVVFYEDMDVRSFKNDGTQLGSTAYITQGSRWIAAYVSYDNKVKSMRLSPTMQLDPGTTYDVHLTRGIKDVAGNPLAADFTWKFTTSGSFMPVKTLTIGATGGSISGRNEIATLIIPPGALELDTDITMEELKDKDIPSMHNAIRYSPAYRFTPEKQLFDTPATIRIRYEQDQVPDPTDLIIAYYDKKQDAWQPFANATINLVDHEIIAPLSTLETITVLSRTDPVPPSTSILSPTGLEPVGSGLVYFYGISNDNVGVDKVEISIMRKSNNSFWDGKQWRDAEVWIPAGISNGRGKKNASWIYNWAIPTDLRDNYRVEARSRDVNGNVGLNAGTVEIVLAGN